MRHENEMGHISKTHVKPREGEYNVEREAHVSCDQELQSWNVRM